MKRDTSAKTRGVYEKVQGSGEWWVRYADAQGKIRREKAGTKAAATQLYSIRKAASLQGQKLPHTLRTKPVTFKDLTKDALMYSRIHKRTHSDDVLNMDMLNEWFGSKPIDSLTPQVIQNRLLRESAERKWKPATTNRMRALLSLIFRLAVEAGKLSTNPIKLIRPLPMDNHVIRYLSDTEEESLKSLIQPLHPERWAAIQFALHTGLRAGEQFGLTWADIHLEAKQPYIR